jgi:hypothetical protein
MMEAQPSVVDTPGGTALPADHDEVSPRFDQLIRLRTATDRFNDASDLLLSANFSASISN